MSLADDDLHHSLGPSPGEPSIGLGFLESDRGRAFRALRHLTYRRLFIAFLVGQTGFWLSHISMQAEMADLADNSTRLQGLLFFALFIPALLVAPFAGLLADRFDRRRIMILSYGLIGCLAVLLAVITATDVLTPGLLLVFALGYGLGFAVVGTASMAVVANSVPDEDLASAISLQSVANNLTRTIGPTIAAFVLKAGGASTSFALYAGALAIVIGLLTRVRIDDYVPDTVGLGLGEQLTSGLRHAHERKPAIPALLSIAVMSVLGVSHVALLPVFVHDVLDRPTADFSWVVATTGVGAMVGALVMGYRTKPPTLRAGAGFLVVYGGALLAFAIEETWVVALLVQLVVGFFYFSTTTVLQTLVQQLVDEAKRGRVMSLFQMAWAGLVPIGGLAMGLIAGPLGVRATIGGAAVVLLVYATGLVVWATRHHH